MLVFKNSGYYKHRNCLDMAIYVLKVQYRGPHYTKLRVLYVEAKSSRLYHETKETVKIFSKDSCNWTQLF
jgi:hypothetical protein